MFVFWLCSVWVHVWLADSRQPYGITLRYSFPLTSPYFSLQAGTKPGGIEKVFINLCQHEGVEKPVMKKRLNDEGEEVEGLNVPLSVGPPRPTEDAKGAKAVV